MLLNEISRHKRAVTIFVLLPIGLSMLAFIPGRVGVADFFTGNATVVSVAKVGKTAVTADEFVNFYQRVQDERSRAGQPATAKDLVSDGTVDAIMENLVTTALITEKTRDEPIHPDQKFLEERLRKDPTFQNERGEFDAGAYNRWVELNTRAGMNWDAVYAGVSEQVNREKYLELIGAGARVPESEVRRQFYDQNTKMRVKAVAVTPKVELSEEQIRAYYDGNLSEFMTPDTRKVDFISISLKAPAPPLVQELIDRARAGEDFAELAKKNSQGIDADTGGDLGWLADSPTVRDHEKPLFEMQVGEIRGPVESFFGLHIYKLEEMRQNEQGVREVHAREIVLRPELPESERTAREARAKALAAKAAAGGTDLAALAAAEGLEVKRTDRLNNLSETIEGVNESDVMPFRTEALKLEQGQISGVISGAQGLYLAQIAEITPPAQKTFEEAHEDVKAAAIRKQKETPEYQQRVNEYVVKIAGQAKSLEDMKTMFPELEVEIKQSESFGLNDMLFSQGILMDGRTLLSRIVNRNAGDFVGPIYDLLRVPNFVEVVERTVPEGEIWEQQYATEKTKIRGDLIRMRQQQQQEDYLRHLRTKFTKDALVQQFSQAIYKILRLDEPGENEAPAEPEPAAAAPVETAGPDVATPVIETPVPATPPADSAAPATP